MTINEALAVGLVVNLGNNDRELVFNAGLQLDDKTVDCYSGTIINKLGRFRLLRNIHLCRSFGACSTMTEIATEKQ